MATERDQEEQDLRIELMSAALDKIQFEMEQARRDHAERLEQWKREDSAREARARQDAEDRKREWDARDRQNRRDNWKFMVVQALALIAVVGTWFGVFWHK